MHRKLVYEQLRECSEGTYFLTYQMIKNIKLPVAFRRESFVSISYHFSKCSRNLDRKGEFPYWVTKISQYFEDKLVQISLNFWLSFTSYFSYDKLIGLGMPLFYCPYFGSVRQKIIVMIIKYHTYTH